MKLNGLLAVNVQYLYLSERSSTLVHTSHNDLGILLTAPKDLPFWMKTLPHSFIYFSYKQKRYECQIVIFRQIVYALSEVDPENHV